MILTQREKYIAFALGGLIAVLVVFFGFVKPYFDRRGDVAADIQAKQSEIAKDQAIFAEQAKLHKEETDMIKHGLKDSQSEAKGQIRETLDQWSPQSGINEKTLNDGQIVRHPDYDEISFKLSGWGTQITIAQLIYQCETTTLPLRVTKLLLNPVKEGQDYVYFELTVSTINRSEKDRNTRGRVSSAGVVHPGELL